VDRDCLVHSTRRGRFQGVEDDAGGCASDVGGFRAWKTTTKEDAEEDKWRFGRTSTGEKVKETCAPQ